MKAVKLCAVWISYTPAPVRTARQGAGTPEACAAADHIAGGGELRRLKRQISSSDLAALQEYGARSGQLSVCALQKDIADGIADQYALIQVLDGVFRENYQAVANASQTSLKVANQAAGLGLNGSKSDYVSTAAQFADKLSGYDDISEGLNSLTNDIVLQSQRYADDSERRSAEFASDSGLEVLVTREYDDVGVHTTDKGGGEVCQWCLDRCGTDVPYQEVYDRGMFERHPGCGCIITYKTKKGKFRQGKGDWEHNQWAEVTERERNSRIAISNNGAGQHVTKNMYRDFFIEKVKSGEIVDSLNLDLQSRHIEGNSFGRSYLLGNAKTAQETYKRLHFTGVPFLDKNGNWTHKERAEDNKTIGVFVNVSSTVHEKTNKAMIVYSKTGSHMYPRKG
ncbi:MAG: polymorphic toxin type 50 domain-containing protein [Erysipelotrichaceae bacterium]|nr:polymorphic toxin type 50 domain-containing protein [Erysipelotrichaceae bacterium]